MNDNDIENLLSESAKGNNINNLTIFNEIGMKPFDGEIIYSQYKVSRRFNFRVHKNCLLILTNKRIINTDKKKNKYSFNIFKEKLKESVFINNPQGKLIIQVNDEISYQIGFENKKIRMEFISTIKDIYKFKPIFFDHLTTKSKEFWCFHCDQKKEATWNNKCSRCGSKLVTVQLKSSINKERVFYLIFLAIILVILLLIGEPNDAKIRFIWISLFAYSFFTIGSYWIVFNIGHYFGFPSGKELFTIAIPENYPDNTKRRFLVKRLIREVLFSLLILAAGIFIWQFIKIFK